MEIIASIIFLSLIGITVFFTLTWPLACLMRWLIIDLWAEKKEPEVEKETPLSAEDLKYASYKAQGLIETSWGG